MAGFCCIPLQNEDQVHIALLPSVLPTSFF